MLPFPCVTSVFTKSVRSTAILLTGISRPKSTASKSRKRPPKAFIKFKTESQFAANFSIKTKGKDGGRLPLDLEKKKPKMHQKTIYSRSAVPKSMPKAAPKAFATQLEDRYSVSYRDPRHPDSTRFKRPIYDTRPPKLKKGKPRLLGDLYDPNHRPLKTFNKAASHLTRASRPPTLPEDSNTSRNAPLVVRPPKTQLCVSEFVAPKANAIEQLKPLDKNQIPRLAHNLDRALFSPGVHYFQDPRTRVYNFSPFLKNIVRYQDFDFDSIATFQTVSKDEALLEACLKNGKRFYSSTSSMTSTLTQFYMLLNNYTSFPDKSRFKFRFGGLVNSLPSSLFLIPKGKNLKGKTIYAVESDKSADYEILLSAMGHCLEALLTTDEGEFDQYRMGTSQKSRPEENVNTYNYATIGDFVMRSQLDCFDDRLPGNGTFDLKTRAALTVRHDARNPDVENNHYQIWKQGGRFESFEREVGDMIRTGAMLKYAFQARIGQMDGIYVAYHNVNTFFGFQYLPLRHLDEIFYSHRNYEDPIAAIPQGDMLDSLAKLDLDAMPENLPTFVAECQFATLMHIWQDLLYKIVERKLSAMNHDGPYRIVIKSEEMPEGQKVRICAYAQAISTVDMDELQNFPSRFKTSFREPITEKSRRTNLSHHRIALINYNRRLAERSSITCFYITVDEHCFDGIPATEPCAYPPRVGAEWNVKYTIRESEEDASLIRARFVSLNEVSCDALVQQANAPPTNKDGAPSRAQERQMYQHLGLVRRSRWKHKDDNPVVYQPKF